jgi:prolipoprotein diacylglyceryl transferase
MNATVSIGGVVFHGYGLVMGLAILVGWEWAMRQAKRWGVEERVFSRLAIAAVVAGVVGARMYHVIDYWDYYLAHPELIVAVWRGGLAIWGAVIGGALGILVASRLMGKWLVVPSMLGAVALALPLSQAIGRVGNWLNGELYGRVTSLPWGVPIPGEAEARGLLPNTLVHPLYWYEASLNLLLFVGLHTLPYFKRDPWLAVSGYLVGYGLIRLLLEPLRWEIWRIGLVPVAWWMAGLAIVVGLVIGYKRRK